MPSSPGRRPPPGVGEGGPAGRLCTGRAAPSRLLPAKPRGPTWTTGRPRPPPGTAASAGTASAQRVQSLAPARPAHGGSAAQIHVSVAAALPSGAPRTCRPRTATAGAGRAAGGACLLVPAHQTSVGEAGPRPLVRRQVQSFPAAPRSSGGTGAPLQHQDSEALEQRSRAVILVPPGLAWPRCRARDPWVPRINGDGGGPHLTGPCASDASQGWF